MGMSLGVAMLIRSVVCLRSIFKMLQFMELYDRTCLPAANLQGSIDHHN